MTTFGVIFLGILTILLFLPYKYMVGTLIIVCPFMVTSAASVGGKYIQPYLLCEVFIVLKSTFAWLGGHNMQINKVKSLIVLLLCFVLYCTIITLIGPNLFDGMEVVDKNLDDSFWNGYKKLYFSINNVTQIGYLMLNLTTLVCVLLHHDKIELKFLRKTFITSVAVSLTFGYWEFLSKMMGFSFPYDILMTGRESGMYVATVMGRFRMSSLCTEASTFGAFIASAFWAVMTMRKSIWHYLFLILIFGAVVLSMSGTAYIAFSFGIMLYLYNKGISPKYIISVLIVILVSYLILNYIEYYKDIFLMISKKSESSSGQVRLGTAIRSLQIFIESYGLGVGLGSTRSSSFLADMLAQVGLIGTCLLAILFYKLIFDLKKKGKYLWIFYYTAVLMFCQILAESDFSYSCFWMGLFIAASCHGIIPRKAISAYLLLYSLRMLSQRK